MQLIQDRIQVGLIEAAVAMLVDGNIVGVEREFRHDFGVPSVADEHSTCCTVRGVHVPPSNTELQVPHPVRSIGSTQIREIQAKAHLEVDDLYAGTTRGRQDVRRSGRWRLWAPEISTPARSNMPPFAQSHSACQRRSPPSWRCPSLAVRASH